MQKHIITIALFFSTYTLLAQKISKFWIEFTDKDNTPYCTCRPAEFLSARALERRANAGIAIVENDLPVDPAYLEALKKEGAVIHHTSRWLNAAAIMSDSLTARRIERLPFVRKIQYLGPHLKYRHAPNRSPKKRAPLAKAPAIEGDDIPLWGYAGQQNQLLGIPALHTLGHRGKDIWVAVMDGGFTNTDTIPMFDSVALQGRLIPGWDFVERDAGVFEGANHGTSVLSVMASNLPQYYVGTAPDATYFLLKTEDTGGEFPIEEANWVAGAEWADSVGCNIVNASLGYTSYNDPSLSHTYATLDGRSSIASRGAAIAATKGMIICNSAGNEGDGAWHFIGVPADAPGILAVGAVDGAGAHAAFSSYGPTPDGRIKPDLVAPGDQVVVAGNVGIALGLSSGTSLASPMLAGALASLWSAYPDKTAEEVMEAAFAVADQAAAPDNQRGYGLPDVTGAWIELGEKIAGNGGIFSYDPTGNQLEYHFANHLFKPGDRIELRDMRGKTFETGFNTLHTRTISTLELFNLHEVPAGYYQIVLANSQNAKRLGAAVWR
ncbi:MAG: S8 family serine peptidase [Saprospiraceae bacterium]|nr:S8 family serine peptidase [Saprospiraceae bacterium]